jgi:hypothetical protein
MVANAPLKLPTGVRAALTMTTSSDMDTSWSLSDLVFEYLTTAAAPATRVGRLPC